MVKKRERQAPEKPPVHIDAEKMEAFVSGAEGEPQKPVKTVTTARTTISLPADLLVAVEDQAMANKRAGAPNRTVSAIVRAALEEYMKS